MNPERLPLRGQGILITRPAAQSDSLASRIADLGGNPVLFPTVEIAPPTDLHALAQAIGRLRDFDFIIFVSPTAVDQVWPHVLARHGEWPHGFSLLAVGQGSARALTSYGARHVLAPDTGADSESLLALDVLQDVAGKKVLIFRGEGGRELLADTLRQRGADVAYAECYRRRLPDIDTEPLLELWRRGMVTAVTATSGEILANLFLLLAGDAVGLVRATPLFALHQRIAAAAREHGVRTVIVTAPGEDGLVAGLVEWFGRAHG